MRKSFIKIFLFLVCASAISANKLDVFVDYAVFRSSPKFNLLEVYYGFIDTSLSYIKKGTKYIAEVSMQMQFFQNDSLLDTYDWLIFHERTNLDFSPEKQNLLVGQKNFQIETNRQVKVFLKCHDMNDTLRKFIRIYEVEPYFFDTLSPSVSEIQIVQNIERSDTSSTFWPNEFVKGKYYVIPNPTREIIGTFPRLYTYFEYYLPSSFLNKKIKIEYRIFDVLRKESLLSFKNVTVQSTSQFDVNGIALDALTSGMYFFEARLVEQNGREIAKSKLKKFYLLNPELPPSPIFEYTESELFEKSIFATLDESAAKKEFEKAKYIATPYEIELFSELTTIEGKRRFLFDFWKKRNPDTTLIFNKAYDDFNQKIEYANRFFSVGKNIEGWRTDRGRILIQYGEPTSREFHPRDGNKKSYEIWFYSEVQGGAYFYFVDINGTGNYILVHSTAMGEVYNENWYSDFVTGTNTERLQKMLLKR
ncbi:MAG: GWxTD domain-containing protein [Ignavibacteria bacterium]|nr:GWxTD domain-containing protein [Ignavibacteria bacterium]